ncbi:MAG: malto-oligosyltrehalose trehalohydrolase [Actinobacteria bacterium]|nr:malto-oligosyltrehalose trehalohydrolase [Actinomycetota bacterium]
MRPDGRTSFLVWAPTASAVDLLVDGRDVVTMSRDRDGYHLAVLDDVPAGSTYRYRLHRDGEEPVERADPASRSQPEGLHGPSAVDDAGAFDWTDAGWRAPPLREQVLYELHVGTFTPEGTFDAIVPRLGELRELGVTTIELMPVWQFPGERNWGYDGVLPYAVQDSYGGPDGLRRLVDAAHGAGVAVVLDVVYNHYGPEGNHLRDFGPYFTDAYDTPWGDAVNVDGPGSDHVRRFIVDNAVRWVTDFHLDGLRLDAVHAVIDRSAVPWLEELATAVHGVAGELGRTAVLIAESDLQDPRLVRPPERGGYGLDAQWLDDVHHVLRTALTSDRSGYFADFSGLPDLARAARDRYVVAGRYSSFRGRTIGRPAPDVPYERFVVCTQNHDQVGNRMLGERLNELVDPAQARLAAAAVLLSPFTPMLWMGEEYAEPAPFQYFVSHTDPDLVTAVREGRRREFADFAWQGEAPDPQAPETFERSKLDWDLRSKEPHAATLELYRELLRLRRDVPAIAGEDAGPQEAVVHDDTLVSLRRRAGAQTAVTVLHAGDEERTVTLELDGRWRRELDTADHRYGGPGIPDDTRTLDGSDGRLEVTVAPWTLVLLTQETHPR